jgi:error-prone DNA polymerase
MQVTSNFTFLTGASHPEELVEQAAAFGHEAIAITDRNSLAGIVRAHVAARDRGIRLVVGCRLDLADAPSLLVHPTGPGAYAALCRLLSVGRRRAPKGACDLRLADVLATLAGLRGGGGGGGGGDRVASDRLMVTLVPPPHPHAMDAREQDALREQLAALAAAVPPDTLSMALVPQYDGEDRPRVRTLAAIAEAMAAAGSPAPLLAANDVLYHRPDRKPLQDVLTCIRHRCTIHEAGSRLWPHAERRLRSAEDARRLFAALGRPEAVDRALAVAERCRGFSLDQLRYQYPEPDLPPGRTAAEHLRSLVEAGARERYPGAAGVPEEVRRQIEHELSLIEELRYEPYFLTVHDIVRFARSRGILCQGRGAAANSAVCFCLGLTSVDPVRVRLLFERFVSRERDEPPDIDIDFEHHRREEVIQYIYRRYGRERAALTAAVISYRGRSAVRDVGTAMGLSLDCVDRLARAGDRWHADGPSEERIRELGLSPEDPTIAAVRTLVRQLVGFPRHLSQHVGGFVITRGPLEELVPVENAAMEGRTVIEWDKDDIEAMGMLKIDVLALGMLSCVRRCFELIDRHEGRTLSLATVPPEDSEVYDMICRADTVGVFQIESRAQMAMLPRLRPRTWYDLVIEVAIVRPGPIQGDMVHPYLRRRQGLEPVTYPSEAVRQVLERTLGVPLFQEQAMALAVVAAGFTLGEADRLRRAMAAWKRRSDEMAAFGERLVGGMLERGYTRDFAERVFAQLRGFSEYGFPESHAASFALIVYASCWLKHHHPSVFLVGLLDSQPMGFYAPAQLVADARRHGVDVRPVDVNFSGWSCRLESVPLHPVTGRPDTRRAPVRLGMRLVKGLAEEDALRVDRAVRERGPFHSITALWRASGVSLAALKRLARADAFRSMGLDRQKAQWTLSGLREERLPLFEDPQPPVTMGPEITPESTPTPVPTPAPTPAPQPEGDAEEADDWLPPVGGLTRVLQDYDATALSLRDHPVAFLRPQLAAEGVIPAEALQDPDRCPPGAWVRVAGIALVRQRPSTASGVVFITIEDESGVANLIIRPHVYERHRRAARHGVVLLAAGTLERASGVVHVMARRIESLDRRLSDLRTRSRDFH